MILIRFGEGESVSVWPGIFHLTRVANTGAAFGLMKNYSRFLTFLTAAAILLILFFIRRSLTSSDRNLSGLTMVGWALVLGGAAGNLCDRLYFGHVVDFLDFRVWPVFNIADSAICFGVFLIILNIFKTAGAKG